MQTPAGKATSLVAGFAHPPRNMAALGIDPGMRVADFGSGSGAYALLMAKAVQASGRVFAVDVQQDLLRRLRNEAQRHGYDNIDVLWGDLERPGGSKIADNSIDVVLISNLLFQVDDIDALFTEARRILRRAGRLAVIDWSDASGGSLGPQRTAVVSKDVARSHAAEAGFDFVREFDAGAHHYGLVMRAV